MNDTNASPPSARVRPNRWFTPVWILPLLAALLVGALAVRSLAERGPLITIAFADAEGLEAGTTPIRHKDVDLGTVESIHLSPDLSQVIVRARMRRSIGAHLTSGTRFWIVRPRVGVEGISGLSTLVSGSYIEMYPGHGTPQRQFVGLAEPPVLTPDTPGRSFTLHSSNLGSLMAGSPISYRGVQVGQIQGYSLSASGNPISLFAFIRAPYEKLVNAESRFWNSGGLDVSIGGDGVRLRVESWQALISGGVSFDTPDSAANLPQSAVGTVFALYDSEGDAQQQPRGPTRQYVVDFRNASGAVAKDSAVNLLGSQVGRVIASQLQYDDTTHSLLTRVRLEIDPSRLQILHGSARIATQVTPSALDERLHSLVRRGLRARLTAANLLTGTMVVSLDMLSDVPPAHIDAIDGFARLPSAASADLSSLLASAQGTLQHFATATAGPHLGHAIAEFDQTMTHLDQASATLEPQIQPLMTSLRTTLQATQHTIGTADQVLGNGASSAQELPRLIRELTEAARSTRDLTDYLDRHPEALLRGRKADQ
jgi:paraquat-inducible protein B